MILILREQEMFFFLNLDLSYRWYLDLSYRWYVYFDNLCRRSLPTWKKSYPYLLIFAPIKDFLDVCNVEYPSQM